MKIIQDAIRAAAPEGSAFWSGSTKLPLKMGMTKLLLKFRGHHRALDVVLGEAAKMSGVFSAEAVNPACAEPDP